MKGIVAIGILFGTGILFAQDSPFVFEVESNSISTEVSVTDAVGKPVIDLTKDAFSIYEDGKLQTLTGFLPVEAPCSALLLFDRTSSTENEWPLLQGALNQFMEALKPQDSISIATFTDSTDLRLNWWNLSKGRPADVLTNVKIGDTTDFYGAIGWAQNRFKNVNARKVIVVLSDGLDSTRIMSRYTPDFDDDFQKLLRSVRTGKIPYYFVAVNTDVDSKTGSALGRLRMEQLAEASGGGMLIPQTADDIATFFGDIAHILGTQYSLAYQQPVSSRDGKSHKIEVRLRDPKLTAHLSRDHYVSN